MNNFNNYNSRTLDSYTENDTLVFALGGLGEVGKNTYCVQHNDEIIIIDAGILFPDDTLLGVEYVIPDYTYLIQNQEKIKALIVTHGHEDHIGGIPYLLRAVNVPAIYASKFTIELIRKKLDETHLLNRTELIPIDASIRPSTKYFHWAFFKQIHSIPDSYGIALQTPNGWILSTGDFKFDLTPVGSNADYQVIAFLGQVGITLLLSDSTNSEVKGFSISEKDVAKSLNEITAHTMGRLIVATFASNVHRIQQIIQAGIENGRKICIVGRSMENVIDISRENGFIKAKDSDFITTEMLSALPDSKILILCTGSQGEPMAALSRMANGTHKDVYIKPNDTIVFSSNPIPGNATSVNGVVNQLTRLGANVLTNSLLNNLHTTGHASKDEQKLMLQLVKPKFFMPMHGEYKMLRMHADTAVETGVNPENIFICGNGDVLIMRNEEVYQYTKQFHADDVYIDGSDVSGVAVAVLKDRRILADNGMVAVIITIDSRTNTIVCRPSVLSRGFIYVKEGQTLLKEAELVVYEALRRKMAQKVTFSELKNTIKDALEPFFYNRTKRSPIIIPVILNNVEANNAYNKE